MIVVNGKHYNYTYGEAVMKARESYDVEDGIALLNIPPHAPQLTKEEAIKYYNKKLRVYWLENLSDSIPVNKKEKALDYLLGA